MAKPTGVAESVRAPDDDQFDETIRKVLKDYIFGKLSPVVMTDDKSEKLTYVRPDAELASVLASYVALRSQEHHSQDNKILQAVIVVLAAAQVISAVIIALFVRR